MGKLKLVPLLKFSKLIPTKTTADDEKPEILKSPGSALIELADINTDLGAVIVCELATKVNPHKNIKSSVFILLFTFIDLF